MDLSLVERKRKVKSILVSQLEVGDIANLGLRLGDQDAFYFAFTLNQ
jgi:hypothetical protein